MLSDTVTLSNLRTTHTVPYFIVLFNSNLLGIFDAPNHRTIRKKFFLKKFL